MIDYNVLKIYLMYSRRILMVNSSFYIMGNIIEEQAMI